MLHTQWHRWHMLRTPSHTQCADLRRSPITILLWIPHYTLLPHHLRHKRDRPPMPHASILAIAHLSCARPSSIRRCCSSNRLRSSPFSPFNCRHVSPSACSCLRNLRGSERAGQRESKGQHTLSCQRGLPKTRMWQPLRCPQLAAAHEPPACAANAAIAAVSPTPSPATALPCSLSAPPTFLSAPPPADPHPPPPAAAPPPPAAPRPPWRQPARRTAPAPPPAQQHAAHPTPPPRRRVAPPGPAPAPPTCGRGGAGR